jgi:hypothetical protein
MLSHGGDGRDVAINSAAWALGAVTASVAGGKKRNRLFKAERSLQCRLLREIVGLRPSRRLTINPAWRTANVAALAQSIYDDRAFDRLPILADALEDAGCDNADILNHCRQPGEHVRGCWVVDLVLGRE